MPSLTKEIFDLPYCDYILERFNRFEKLPTFDLEKVLNAPIDNWVLLNRLWMIQYYNVKFGKIKPEEVFD